MMKFLYQNTDKKEALTVRSRLPFCAEDMGFEPTRRY